MHKIILSEKARKTIIAIVALVLCTIVFIARVTYIITPHPWISAGCDALFGIGLLYIVWGIILYATFKGGFDGLFYIAQNIANIFKKGEKISFVTYGDFIDSRERVPNSYKTFLSYGGIMLAGAAVFLILYFIFCSPI